MIGKQARAARWRRNLERMKTEPGLKKNVVVIATLVILATITGGWILSNQRFSGPWTDSYTVSAEFEAVPGIAPGNGQEVRMHGVIVGQIAGAEVNDEGRAVLRMELEPGHEVYDNATMVLRPKSPLNEMYVTVDPGGPPGKKLPSGATLPVTSTQRPIQIDEVLGSLDDQARSALTALLREADDALATAPDDLPAGLDATGGALEELQPVVTQLETRRESLRRLVTALSQITDAVGDDDARLLSLAGSLDTTLQAVADESGSLDATLAQLPGLTRQLGTATVAVRRLSEQLDPTLREVQSATDVLPEALEGLTSTATRLRETVELATPVIADARPVIGDLRPYIGQLRTSLPIFERTTARLDPVTSVLLKYLPDLGAFMVNTRSLTSMRDGNGGILRGMLEITSTTLPTGTLAGLSPGEVEGPLG